MAKQYNFTHAIEYYGTVMVNLFHGSNDAAKIAAKAIVDIMIAEWATTETPMVREGFKLVARQMRSIPPKVKTKATTSSTPHPAEEEGAKAPTKAKARTKKAKAE